MEIPKRITQSWIEDQISETKFHFDESDNKKWCTCECTLNNGFVVCKTAYRQFSVQHVKEVARSSAYEKVIDKLYSHFSFLSHWVHHD